MKKGISLIILVITVFVMIILAGVVIVGIAGVNPIAKANEASFRSDLTTYTEELESFLTNAKLQDHKFDPNDVYSENEDMKNYIPSMKEKYYDTLEIVEGELVFKGENPEQQELAKDLLPLRVGDLLKDVAMVGDYVNYDAGNWTEEEISKIGATGTAEGPAEVNKFCGFTAGLSRNDNTTNSYYTNIPYSGWRVFDIDDTTGAVTLISAGIPEVFSFTGGNAQTYLDAEKILTGTNKTGSSTSSPRDYSMYLNKYSNDARVFVRSDALKFVNKNIDSSINVAWGDSPETFKHFPSLSAAAMANPLTQLLFIEKSYFTVDKYLPGEGMMASLWQNNACYIAGGLHVEGIRILVTLKPKVTTTTSETFVDSKGITQTKWILE